MAEPLTPQEQPDVSPDASSETSTPSSHDEIAALERLLEEKKQALAVEGRQQEERETFREAFRETYAEAFRLPAAPAAPAAIPPAPLSRPAAGADDLRAKGRQEQLESLVSLAFTNGVRPAVELARRATPWLMDELHDTLQDRYYQELVAARQLRAF